VVLLAAWLAVTTVSVAGPNPFVLEVPANYLSVGQQFQPRLVSQAPSAAVPAAEVTLELRDARGQHVAAQKLELDGAATRLAEPLALPGAGRYTLRARAGKQVQTITLHALPEPPADYGGVLAIAGLGLAPGVADYLRQHSFVVEDPGPASSAHLLVVGDPRLDGHDLLAQYTQLWQTVSAGANALLLEPPPPGVAQAWPLTGPLAPPTADCSDDLAQPPLAENLQNDAALAALLRPTLSFDLGQQSSLDLYHWDGRRLARPNNHSGYRGCYPLVSYRYGDGWVTVSTLPLLQHFQDARAPLYLMNLLRAEGRRKRHVPASPGLAWVMQQRLKSLAAATALSPAAVYYRPPPAAVEPAATLVPAATDPNPQTCWSAPPAAAVGATLTLDLGRPQEARTLTLAFARWPANFKLAASPDGRRWSPLPAPEPPASGPLALPLPAGDWRAFRLALAATPWRVCQFTAQ